MMRKVKLCMDCWEYRVKPTGTEIGRINSRIARRDGEITLCGIDDFKEFVDRVGQHGVTFSPATYRNESRSTKNFAQMQLIVLDFDKGISYEKVMNRAREYDLPVIIAYETLSSEGQNKFRVIFQNSTSITNVRLAKIILNALYTIFPEADQRCNDISKMFFGGKKLLYFDESLPMVDPESILRNMTFYLKNRRGLKHYKAHIAKFAENNGIRLTKKGLLDISISNQSTEVKGTFQNGKNPPSAILLIKDHGEIFPNTYSYLNLDDGCTQSSVDKNQPERQRPHR